MSLANIEFSLEDLAAAEAATANPYLADPTRGLQLVTRLIAHPPARLADQPRQHLTRLHRLIHEDFVSLAARDDYPAEAEAFRSLLALEESLDHLAAFPDLANRIVVGVGGGFSAGKSRFLNTLLGEPLLPESLQPTTAIPTFLMGGDASIVALNTFDRQVVIDADALQAITHDFHRHYRATLGDEVGFAHVVKLLLIRRPAFRWGNLAFLDTPGYSKADAPSEAPTDEKIALRQLTEADHVIWLINAKNGSMRRDDLDFLRALNHPKPIFFVVTQADLVPPPQVERILDSTAQALDAAGVVRAGLMAWSAPLSVRAGERLAGRDIRDWLAQLNGGRKYTSKRATCERMLDVFIDHNEKSLALNRQRLTLLNALFPLADQLSESERQEFRALIQAERTRQKQFGELKQEFETLKARMLEVIGQLVGELAVEDDQSAQSWYLSGMRFAGKSDRGSDGRFRARDETRAGACFARAAELGHAGAQTRLGELYERGRGGLARDPAQALGWYRKAAEQDDREARTRLGRMYAEGIGTPADAHQAAHWYRLAAEQGCPEARTGLGRLYDEGQGVRQCDRTAVEWYRKAAQQGDPEAQARLAEMYFDGRGVKQDDETGKHWLRLALDEWQKRAQQGDANAQFMLGRLHDEGAPLVKQNAAQAAIWYRRAAEQGETRAQLMLFFMYFEGRGVPRDEAIAADWCRRVARQGEAGAQYILGSLYLDGCGVPQHDVQGVKWLRKSALRGDPDAQYELGRCYESGRGVPKDARAARDWYAKAAEQGHPEAGSALNQR